MMTNRRRAHLVHHIDEGLHVVPKEAADCVTLVLTREDYFNQGGEFVRSERASDQTPAGWGIVENAGVISTPYDIGEGRSKAHRSRIWRSWHRHENLRGGMYSVC